MKLPRVSGNEMVRALTRAGWKVHRQRGSHIFLYRDDDRTANVTVPVHGNEDLSPFVLQSIMKQSKLGRDGLLRILGKE